MAQNGRGIQLSFSAIFIIDKNLFNEPHKNEELRWFDIDSLPTNIVNDRIIAIENYKQNIKYSEYGW